MLCAYEHRAHDIGFFSLKTEIVDAVGHTNMKFPERYRNVFCWCCIWDVKHQKYI